MSSRSGRGYATQLTTTDEINPPPLWDIVKSISVILVIVFTLTKVVAYFNPSEVSDAEAVVTGNQNLQCSPRCFPKKRKKNVAPSNSGSKGAVQPSAKGQRQSLKITPLQPHRRYQA